VLQAASKDGNRHGEGMANTDVSAPPDPPNRVAGIGRRELITLLAGAAAGWPLAARAQQGERVRRVGVLAGLPEDDVDMRARLAGFRQGLEKLGWVEGRNIRIDARFAPAGAQVQARAQELVALQPDVILAHSPPIAVELHRQTRAIPVVFASVGDPIGLGLIASLNRPGGNFTGLMTYEAGIAGKWVLMLREVAPMLKRAAVVASRQTTTYDYYLRAAEAVAPSLAIELVPTPVDTAAEIERAIEAFARVPDGGLIVLPDPLTNTHSALIVALAARYRLPAVYWVRLYVVQGGLMSYGSDRVDELRQAASYVDRILRGAKPADLPVQTPTKFETAVNLKTAKALGLTVPPALVALADEVIE
jgi:putative tryptophan/tyrosine transport system substrate-binding protein